MSFASAEKIADAVLFEGYMLYPYRPSALKNQKRWNFGTLWPQTYALAQRPPESYQFHTEVLVIARPTATVNMRLRFLQLIPQSDSGIASWDIGIVRSKTIESIQVEETRSPVHFRMDLSTLSEEERATAPPSFEALPSQAQLEYRITKLQDSLFRICITVSNQSNSAGFEDHTRQQAQASAFTSAHLLLSACGGNFVSLLDPSPEFAQPVAACRNQGVFPVLAGPENDSTVMLCSPIILYDHPQIASESSGDFFDGTEMDEMLALRVLTLTDEEKREMQQSDPHARAILDRVDAMAGGELLKVHGATRPVSRSTTSEPNRPGDTSMAWNPFEERPALESVSVSGFALRTGDRVRLWPRKKADIIDSFMEGRIATIEAIEQDLEGNVQFAVVLEDDPGRDLGLLRQAGHRFFFSPEEVEPLPMEVL